MENNLENVEKKVDEMLVMLVNIDKKIERMASNLEEVLEEEEI